MGFLGTPEGDEQVRAAGGGPKVETETGKELILPPPRSASHKRDDPLST